LKFSGRQLPDWGFNQHEVVTDKIISQDDTVWNVEEHRYTKSKNFLTNTLRWHGQRDFGSLTPPSPH